jgi:hypothetical protein
MTAKEDREQFATEVLGFVASTQLRFDELQMRISVRFAELEARIATLEAGEPDPARAGRNLQGASTSASAELSRNASQRLIESRASWK